VVQAAAVKPILGGYQAPSIDPGLLRCQSWHLWCPARQFTVTRPNKAWVADISYIRTWEGWLYLAVVMDLFSRKIVGWLVSSTIHREVVLDAIIMAVRRRLRRQEAILSLESSRAEHEPQRQLLGQRSSGVLLQQPEERTYQEADLQEQRNSHG
jgi:transposase InsO family protein